MKALFLTTKTIDCANHVRAWESVADEPATHVSYNHRFRGLRDYGHVVRRARREVPDVMFYIGAHDAPGNPTVAALRELRSVAPFIHLCSDAGDKPWHGALHAYKHRECFDLQVGIDGVRDAPGLDLATLTPVDARLFLQPSERSPRIRCGFSGTVGRWNPRSEVVNALAWFGGLTVRRRDEARDSYEAHVAFVRRCRMLLNTSWTGSGARHHVKGRVLEAGLAGCALLEHEASPFDDWFPAHSALRWSSARDVAHWIERAEPAWLDNASAALRHTVTTRYSAYAIFSEILEHVGLSLEAPSRVDRPVAG